MNNQREQDTENPKKGMKHIHQRPQNHSNRHRTLELTRPLLKRSRPVLTHDSAVRSSVGEFGDGGDDEGEEEEEAKKRRWESQLRRELKRVASPGGSHGRRCLTLE